jgi:hypothetical protein
MDKKQEDEWTKRTNAGMGRAHFRRGGVSPPTNSRKP